MSFSVRASLHNLFAFVHPEVVPVFPQFSSQRLYRYDQFCYHITPFFVSYWGERKHQPILYRQATFVRADCWTQRDHLATIAYVTVICATRLPNATAKIRWTNCVLQIFFAKNAKKNAKRNAPQNSHFHISTHRCIFNFFYNNIILYIIIIIHISQPTQMCGNVKMWIFLFIWLFLSRPNKFLLLHCKRLYLSILLKHIERTDSI